MKKILVTDGIHPEGQKLLEEAHFQVDNQKIAQEDLYKILPRYDGIIIRSATKVRKDLIDHCPNIQIIARGGVGLDNVDVDYARSKNIEVLNTPAASSSAVAELAFAHMFTLSRFLQLSNREMPSSGDKQFDKLKKAYSKGVQLRGKTLGIIGFGKIGQETARIGLALGMNILPVDVAVSESTLPISLYDHKDVTLEVRIPTVSWDTALENSDFISLHVPFSGSPVIGAKEFGRMKNGVVIINTSRGGIIDEKALLEALDSGKVGGAGLDVFENEPTPMKALLAHPHVSLSPHIGASTVEAQRNIGIELAEKIIAFYSKKTESVESH
jgi:D-3-phosphoglycerate dehydrogenase / 2-oxoglutarate reductase